MTETIQETPILEKLLHDYRKKRNFQVADYVDQKLRKINEFFEKEGLDAAVIGISGGVDSAVVLNLMNLASKAKGSPIKMILPLSLPIYDADGVTGQIEAARKAQLVMTNAGFNYNEMNLHDSYHDMIKSMNRIPSITKISTEASADTNTWSNGQMASVLRTPALYFAAARLQIGGYKSLVVGTTNRDEGSYIGFFGKASDAMVDLQPIADIHKSEVWKVAKFFGIPEEIINAAPRGDVWDDKTDEEMIGAPYWVLEVYHYIRGFVMAKVTSDPDFLKYFEKIEEIHKKNAHKYKVGSPARYIDVYDRKMPGYNEKYEN